MRPLFRSLLVPTLAAVLAWPLSARAGKNTYCVGGFGGQEACNNYSVASQHSPWHPHNCVTDGEHAYHCWDEEDDSCDTNFIASHRSRGWKVADPYECSRLPAAPSTEVAAHVSLGRQIVDAMEAERQRQAEMQALMEAARQEAARLAAQQEAARQAAEAARLAELRRQEEEQQRIAALKAQQEAERLAREAQEAAEKARLEQLAREAREKAEREAAEAAAAAKKAAEEEAARKAAEEAARLAKLAADAETAKQAAELAAAQEAARKAKEAADREREANKPLPVALRTEIVRVSPGPYAAGDVVSIVARIVGPEGKIRSAGGGEGTRTAADQTTKTERARLNPDGTFTVSFALPAGGDSDVSVVGSSPRLLPKETLQGTISPANQHLSVSPCRLRTRLVSPQNGAASTPGTTALKGELVDAQGKPVGDAAALNGAKLAFTVESSAGDKLRADGTLGSDGAVTGALELPPPKGDDKLTFALVAEGGSGDVCPGPSAETSLSLLGVAIDLSTLPKKCYAGRPCPIDVTLRLPDEPKSRAVAEAFSDAPDLKADASLGGGEPASLAKGAAGSLHGEIVPPAPGDQEISFRVFANGKTVEAKGVLPVRWPLQLKAPADVDLGAIEAGTRWTETCRTLVFDGSTGLEEQDVRITVEAPAGSAAYLVGNFGGLQAKYADGVTLAMDASRSIPVCLVTSGGKSETQAVKLHVAAVDKDFADQQTDVTVKYEVRGKGFLARNLWWLAAIAGVFAFGAFAYGFVSPFDFGGDDVLRVANKEAALPRAVARRLRELPGGKRGWYRSATFGLRSDGSITDKTGTAAVVFVAKRGDITVSARGGLQRLNARTHKLEPVSDPQSHSLTKNAIYESGGLFFKVS